MQYRTFNYNKLVRDKMVQRSEATGSIVHWKKLDDKEFEQALRIKCMEEAEEIFSAQSKDGLIEELADMLEIINAFCDMYQVTLKDVVAIQEQKYQERGGFKDHICIVLLTQKNILKLKKNSHLILRYFFLYDTMDNKNVYISSIGCL